MMSEICFKIVWEGEIERVIEEVKIDQRLATTETGRRLPGASPYYLFTFLFQVFHNKKLIKKIFLRNLSKREKQSFATYLF